MSKLKHRDRTQLTSREIEMLDLQEQGFTHEQISKKLGISRGTIKAHILSAHWRIRAKEQSNE